MIPSSEATVGYRKRRIASIFSNGEYRKPSRLSNTLSWRSALGSKVEFPSTSCTSALKLVIHPPLELFFSIVLEESDSLIKLASFAGNKVGRSAGLVEGIEGGGSNTVAVDRRDT